MSHEWMQSNRGWQRQRRWHGYSPKQNESWMSSVCASAWVSECVFVCQKHCSSARISFCGMNLNWGSRIVNRKSRIYEIAIIIIIIINTKKFRSILQQLYHWIPCELWIEYPLDGDPHKARHREFRIRIRSIESPGTGHMVGRPKVLSNFLEFWQI